MHVNSYFIETLVLCFSCGCDKDNLNYDNIRNFSTGTECSMNTPARMIIGKHLQWTENVGGDGECSGPELCDLEPVKTLVQLQFKQKSTCDGPPLTPGGRELCEPDDPFCHTEPTWNGKCRPGDPFCGIVTPIPIIRTTSNKELCPQSDPFCREKTTPKVCPPDDPYCGVIKTTTEPPYVTGKLCPLSDPFCLTTETGDWSSSEESSEEYSVEYPDYPAPVTPGNWPATTYHPPHWPSPPVVETPVDLQANIIILITGGIKKPCPINEFEGTELELWLAQYPHGQVVVLIVAGETSNPNWEEEIHQTVSATYIATPTYIIVIDWSKYILPDYSVTASYAKIVGFQIGKWIYEQKIPCDRLILIGFGTSAHTAGFAGKFIQKKYGETVYKIIALNPTGMVFTTATSESERLSRLDAKQVLVIHTETSEYGYCCAMGTVDVFVNNPKVPQPWCQGPTAAKCSHSSAVDIFMISIVKAPLRVTKEGSHDILKGYPLEIDIYTEGVYYLIINSPNSILRDLITTTENYGKTEWPPIPIIVNIEYIIDDLFVIGYFPSENVEETFDIQTQEESDHFTIWMNAYPDSRLIIIITEESHDEWAITLKDEYLQYNPEDYVLIIDWSMYVSPSRLHTAWYGKQLAKTIYQWMMLMRIYPERVDIIGFSHSAHVAGIIGNYYAEETGTSIFSIVGLDPIGLMWEHTEETERLTSSSAFIVQVIHTNTQNHGFVNPLGRYDIYVSGGACQPHCENQGNRKDLCSHIAAVYYYIQSISTETYAIEATLVNQIAVESGSQKIGFGYWLVPDKAITANIFVLKSEGGHIVQVPPHLWIREPPGFRFVQIPINLTNGYTSENLKIVGMSSEDTHEVLFPLHTPSSTFENWLVEYPVSEIILIITEEPSSSWAAKLRKELLDCPVHKYVIIVDWSMYVYDSYRFTSAYAFLIAQAVTDWILQVRIPGERLEIIGFSTSAHVAGLAGTYLGSRGNRVHRIVGLDPAPWGWSHPLQVAKLCSSSAEIVQVIHTNTQSNGYPSPLGTHDIYVHGGPRQPLCDYNEHDLDECSHRLAITYYITSIKVYTFAVEARLIAEGEAVVQSSSTPERIGFGYWLVPDDSIKANIFILITKDDKIDPLIPAITFDEGVSNDPSDILLWPPFSPDLEYRPSELTNLVVYVYYYEGRTERELVVYLTGRFSFVLQYLQVIASKNPSAANYMVINGERDKDHGWALELKNTILSIYPDSIAIVADWSYYKHTSYYLTSKFAMPIGNKLAEFIYLAGLSPANLHLIGYSMSAHIAGFVGKTLRFYSLQLLRITGLDPARYMWYHPEVTEKNSLCPSDAGFVDVIHTNTINFGYPAPLGHVDFYVNGGKRQPSCRGQDDECSHLLSVNYFIESFGVKPLAIRVKYQDESKLIFLERTVFNTFGLYADPHSRGVYYIVTETEPPYLKRPPERNPLLESPDYIYSFPDGNADGENTYEEQQILITKQGAEENHQENKVIILPIKT